MAATQVTDDMLEFHVKQVIDRWKQGDLFMTVGIREEDKILEAGSSIPEKSNKEHPFNKFLEVVASDIAQQFSLDRNEKKSILRKLQSKSEKWKELVAPNTCGEQIETPTLKKQNKKETPSKADLLESPQIPQEPLPEPASLTVTVAKETVDIKLEDKKRQFEKTRDEIMSKVPEDVKARFGQIYFSIYKKLNLSVLVMNPYSVPPGEPRDLWLKMCDNTSKQGRTSHMTHLVYWYGSSVDPKDAYSLLQSKRLTPYELGVKKSMHQAAAIQMKLDKGKSLTKNEKLFVDGLKEMEEDLEKPAEERCGYMERHVTEAFELTTDEEDNNFEGETPPLVTKKKMIVNATKTKVKVEKKSKKKLGGKKRKTIEEETLDMEAGPGSSSKKTKKTGRKNKKTAENGSSAIDNFFSSANIKTESVPVQQQETTTMIEENAPETAQDHAENVVDTNVPSPRDPDEDYKFAMGEIGSEEDSDDEYFVTERAPLLNEDSVLAKSKPARSRTQKEVSKKKSSNVKHKIDMTVGKLKTVSCAKQRKKLEMEKFRASKEEFQPVFDRWKVLLDTSDTEALVELFADLIPRVKRIHWALLKDIIKKLLNPSRKVLPDNRKEEYKQLKNALKSHFEATEQDVIPGIDPQKIQLFTEGVGRTAVDLPPQPKAETSAVNEASMKEASVKKESLQLQAQRAALSSPIKRIGSLEKVVVTLESTNSLQRDIKVERKKFSLGNLMRPVEATKSVEKSSSCDKLSMHVQSAKKQPTIPDWVAGKSPVEAPSGDTRTFALEFLQQAVPFIPHNKDVNHDAVAIALEAAIYRKYAMPPKTDDSEPKPESEWVDQYWKKIDDIVVAISGDERSGTISAMIAQGRFASPEKVVELSDEAIFDSFNGKPVVIPL